MKRNNMKKKYVYMACIVLLSICSAAQAYTVNASNFTKPRAKTLRRIAKNLSLALAIESIYVHPGFSADQQILLKSIPSLLSGKFTQESIIQLRDGSRLTLENTIEELKKLEATITVSLQDPALAGKSSYHKVLKSVSQLIEHLEKIA